MKEASHRAPSSAVAAGGRSQGPNFHRRASARHDLDDLDADMGAADVGHETAVMDIRKYWPGLAAAARSQHSGESEVSTSRRKQTEPAQAGPHKHRSRRSQVAWLGVGLLVGLLGSLALARTVTSPGGLPAALRRARVHAVATARPVILTLRSVSADVTARTRPALATATTTGAKAVRATDEAWRSIVITSGVKADAKGAPATASHEARRPAGSPPGIIVESLTAKLDSAPNVPSVQVLSAPTTPAPSKVARTFGGDSATTPPSPSAPSTARAVFDQGKAAAALAAGEYDRALKLYRKLAIGQGENSVYAVIIKFLEREMERSS